MYLHLCTFNVLAFPDPEGSLSWALLRSWRAWVLLVDAPSGMGRGGSRGPGLPWLDTEMQTVDSNV